MSSSIQNLPVVVYECNAWNEFMFQFICPHAKRIKSKIRQSNDEILNEVPEGTGYFLFQINLTETGLYFENKEELIDRLKKRNIRLLNDRIVSISKKKIQDTCIALQLNSTRASKEGDENEILIVKTNLNFGGNPEKKLSSDDQKELQIEIENQDNNINYPVLERKAIAAETWENTDLVIEKYIHNKRNLFYRVYKMMNRLVISEVIDTNLIKKMPEGIFRTNTYCDFEKRTFFPPASVRLQPMMRDLLIFTEAMGIDFGTLDVVKSEDGRYFIIDVNPTPYWGKSGQEEMIQYLAGK